MTPAEELVIPGAAFLVPSGGFGAVMHVSRERGHALVCFQNGTTFFLPLQQVSLAILWLQNQNYEVQT